MNTPALFWIGFFALILLLIIADLGILQRRESEMTLKRSLGLSLGYFLIAVGFGGAVMYFDDVRSGSDFFTSYFIEKNLSLDNIFVMGLVFTHFHIPIHLQRRVLFWGIFGAVCLRGLLIWSGLALISWFHPVLYLFGGFLILTGGRMLLPGKKEEKSDIMGSRVLPWIKRIIPVTDTLHGNRFFIGKSATPLFLALAFIELTDIVFAVDSVPAVLAVTTDPFIVYTSNIFAILGLRALYFGLATVIHRFEYLKYSLACVLIFIGGKIFLNKIILISSLYSLAVIVVLLAGGIAVSLYKTRTAPGQ